MAAPDGNQFWKLRSKHCRDKLFSSHEELLKACEQYFHWCDEHPWIKNEAIKSGEWAGTLAKVPTARPYTIQGLCRYLRCNTLWFNQFEKSLEGKKDSKSKDFSTILTHVRETIYQQKFEGAAVGAFNANIIARDLGLKDNSDVTT